ncbi:MAG: ATP-binding protein [Clostridioides sp.]|jgi:signal transduction histidine kinase|nr:ATP-binding protein [Clostridioides sp.]
MFIEKTILGKGDLMQVSYDVVYVVCNIVMVYTFYKFIELFFEKCRVSWKVKFIFFVGYFLAITIVNLVFKNPIINMFTNIIGLFACVQLYKGEIKKKILFILIIYVLVGSIEGIAGMFSDFYQDNFLQNWYYSNEMGLILARILSYYCVIQFENFKNAKKEYFLPSIYWFSLSVIFIVIIFFFVMFFSRGPVSQNILTISCIVIFIIVILIFYLYDCIMQITMTEVNNRLQDEQNKYYKNQIEIIEDSLENIRMMKHDFKNNLMMISSSIKEGKTEALLEKLDELMELSSNNFQYSNSGNLDIDSIINYKLKNVQKYNIDVDVYVFVPADLEMSSFDISMSLGNLLDNALENVIMIPRDRFINLKMEHSKGQLRIKIKNSFDGYVKRDENVILTRKEDFENHGMGLKIIKNVVEKYNGTMQIKYNDSEFCVNILMYV